MGIPKELFFGANNQLCDQIAEYYDEIDVAYSMDEDEKIAVSAKINFKYDDKLKRVVAETYVSFVKEKITDKRPVDPSGLGPLFDDIEKGKITITAEGGANGKE